MKKKLMAVLALTILCACNASLSTADAQGTAFTYQGQLSSGGSTANGFYDFQFALSNAPSGGSQIGGTVTNLAVEVSNGVFTTTVDFGGVFTGDPAWLAIGVRSNGVGSYTELTPLQPLTSAPYAVFAGTASNLSGTIPLAQLQGAVLTNNEVSVFLNGNFSGNGSGLTNIPLTGLQAVPLTNGQAGVSLNGQTTVSNLSVTATNFANYLVVSNAPALNGSAIFNLNASQLSSGTVATARLATSGTASATTFLAGNQTWATPSSFAMSVTANISLTDGSAKTMTIAHGLGATPSLVRMVLYCSTADSGSGLAVGEEIDNNAVISVVTGTLECSVYANSADLFVSYAGDAASSGNVTVTTQGGAGKLISSMSHFQLKVYYHQ